MTGAEPAKRVPPGNGYKYDEADDNVSDAAEKEKNLLPGRVDLETYE